MEREFSERFVSLRKKPIWAVRKKCIIFFAAFEAFKTATYTTKVFLVRSNAETANFFKPINSIFWVMGKASAAI